MNVLNWFRRPKGFVAKQPPIDLPQEIILKGKLTPMSMQMLQEAINDLRERRKNNRPPSYRSIDQLTNVLKDAMGQPQESFLLKRGPPPPLPPDQPYKMGT